MEIGSVPKHEESFNKSIKLRITECEIVAKSSCISSAINR
jgi:hypothetical protein